jgi:hypothetical protein
MIGEVGEEIEIVADPGAHQLITEEAQLPREDSAAPDKST